MDTWTGQVWFGLLVTLAAWEGASALYRRRPWPVLNPVLLCVAAIIALLSAADIAYADYNAGGRWLSFLLGPAVVALAVPLVRQIRLVTRHWLPILGAVLVGSLTGMVSAVTAVLLLDGSRDLALAMAPKSVTTPIAMGVAQQVGGIPELTVALVILTGILGAMIGPELLRLLRLRNPIATGLGIGAAAHGIGTARAFDESELAGTMSGIAMTLNGLFTAVLLPWVLPWILRWTPA